MAGRRQPSLQAHVGGVTFGFTQQEHLNHDPRFDYHCIRRRSNDRSMVCHEMDWGVKPLVHIKIPRDGQVFPATVTLADGTAVPNVVSVTIDPIMADNMVKANIELFISGDITAHPLLGLDTLREAAAHYGFALVKPHASGDGDAHVGHANKV